MLRIRVMVVVHDTSRGIVAINLPDVHCTILHSGFNSIVHQGFTRKQNDLHSVYRAGDKQRQ